MDINNAVERRRTFAIISHPDAGKTTVTEKFLLLGNAIQLAGTVKAKKANRAAKSDWMAMERERGISVTTSVMQIAYAGRVVNLLDTPGHEDFSEDTYRTLTAVDSVLMVIDAARGVEPRTRKLLEICRLRDIPILTFINKLDREMRDPIELLDQIEDELQIECAPRCWPIGSGRSFRGIYLFDIDQLICYESGHGSSRYEFRVIEKLNSQGARDWLGFDYDDFVDEIKLVKGASHQHDLNAYRAGNRTPVFFGTALHNFGVTELFNEFVSIAPAPRPRLSDSLLVYPTEKKFSGFVFKIQANMDPKHRDRIAFMRICSGKYRDGMRMRHVRRNRDIKINNAVTFMAGDRIRTDEAYAGDIIGLHNHGAIHIGDSFSEGQELSFRGIPNFAPELFRKVRVRNPLMFKRLETGIRQLSEEGATQVFLPLEGNDMIVGTIGPLQFELVAFRLREEYQAECFYEPSSVFTARWITSSNEKKLSDFRKRLSSQLAVDSSNYLTLLATSRVNLELIQERWPELEFASMRDHKFIAMD